MGGVNKVQGVLIVCESCICESDDLLHFLCESSQCLWHFCGRLWMCVEWQKTSALLGACSQLRVDNGTLCLLVSTLTLNNALLASLLAAIFLLHLCALHG